MIDYNKIVDEICANTDVKKEEIFYFEDTPLEPFCNQIFQFSQSYLSDNGGLGFFRIEPARFFINNDTRVNAWAWVNNGYSIISFNIGTIHKLKTIFYDSEDYFEQDETLNEFKEINSLFKDLGSSILETMYHTGLMFLLYHECGHLIQKSERVYDFINESVSKPENFNIYNHQIEVDSDIFASINLGNHAIDIWSKLPKENQTKENLEKVISILVSGIGIYRLFYLQLGNKEMYYEENTHPHFIIRCIINGS